MRAAELPGNEPISSTVEAINYVTNRIKLFGLDEWAMWYDQDTTYPLPFHGDKVRVFYEPHACGPRAGRRATAALR